MCQALVFAGNKDVPSEKEATAMVNNLLQSIAGKGAEGKSQSSPLTSQFGSRDLPPVFSSQNRNGLQPAKVSS